MSTKIVFENSPYSKIWLTAKVSDYNRLNWRTELLLSRNTEKIVGKRVLDLACIDGRFSYAAKLLGAKHVTGVEAREESLSKAVTLFKSNQIEQAEFIVSDLFEYLPKVEKGSFDVILCFGFLYHTTKQHEFFKEINRIKPEYLFLDTAVFKNSYWLSKTGIKKPSCLHLVTENHEEGMNTIDETDIAYWPSDSYLEQMLSFCGYKFSKLNYKSAGIKKWDGLLSYKKGHRSSYIAELSNI